MKKEALILMAGIAMCMCMSVPASAWVKTGILEKERDHVYICNPGSSYCQQSIDPNDPSQNVGDRVLTNYPDKGVQSGTIVAIVKSGDPGSGGGTPSGTETDVQDDATGEVNQVISANQ